MTFDPIDSFLLYCTDEVYRQNFNTISWKERLNPSLITRKLRANKVSAAVLQNLPFFKEIELFASVINEDIEASNQWLDSLSFCAELFRQKKAGCIFIKALNPPWVIMTDLDILPMSGLDELAAMSALKDVGYELYQFRLLRHPLKIMAKKENSCISVDFYPKPMWIRKKVCDTEIIATRKIESSFKGVPLSLPSPEDDLYLDGTHGYSHLKFTIAEILHGINVIDSCPTFDWDYLINLSIDYGTSDAIFSYLKAIDLYQQSVRFNKLSDNSALDRLRKIPICRKIDKWFENNYSKKCSFPITMPPELICGESSFFHSRAMIARLSPAELAYDFLTPYLGWSSKIVLGREKNQ